MPKEARMNAQQALANYQAIQAQATALHATWRELAFPDWSQMTDQHLRVAEALEGAMLALDAAAEKAYAEYAALTDAPSSPPPAHTFTVEPERMADSDVAHCYNVRLHQAGEAPWPIA